MVIATRPAGTATGLAQHQCRQPQADAARHFRGAPGERRAVRESLRTLSNPITRIWRKMRSDLDPNDWRLVGTGSKAFA